MPESDARVGYVFDVQRFSLHDGPGIRTTIFMKGCPLRCAWCQNPEGIPSEMRPMLSQSLCVRCGTCVQEAQDGGVAGSDGRLRVCPNAAEDWDTLMEDCPTGALHWDGEHLSCQDLMSRLRRDVPFYGEEGGVTFSGGEPLLQADFLLEIIEACRSDGIRTAIETSLAVPWSSGVERVLDTVDLIQADCKCADEVQSVQWLGTPASHILSNLSRMLSEPWLSKLIVRSPLVPRFTATPRNVAGIADFLASYAPQVRYELLNYNPLAEAKYEMLGLPYALKGVRPLSSVEMDALRAVARAHGLTNVKE